MQVAPSERHTGGHHPPPKAYSTPYTSTPLWNTPKPHQYVQSFWRAQRRWRKGALSLAGARARRCWRGGSGGADLLQKVIDVQVDGCALPLSGVSKARGAIDAPHWGAQAGAPASLAPAQLPSDALGACAGCWNSWDRSSAADWQAGARRREQTPCSFATAGSSRWGMS